MELIKFEIIYGAQNVCKILTVRWKYAVNKLFDKIK
jgi:hypothetical protein